jgi:hypothetical protein
MKDERECVRAPGQSSCAVCCCVYVCARQFIVGRGWAGQQFRERDDIRERNERERERESRVCVRARAPSVWLKAGRNWAAGLTLNGH